MSIVDVCARLLLVLTQPFHKKSQAELCSEVTMPGGAQRVVKVTGVLNPGKTCSILLRGSNQLTLDEADRSVHDALCVVNVYKKERQRDSCENGARDLPLKLLVWTWRIDRRSDSIELETRPPQGLESSFHLSFSRYLSPCFALRAVTLLCLYSCGFLPSSPRCGRL